MKNLDRRTYSVCELAKILGIGRNSAYSLVQSGQIRHLRVGKLILIPREAVDELLGKER